MSSPNLKATIGQLKKSKAELEGTSMKDVIEASTNFKVVPYSVVHKPLLAELSTIANRIEKKYSSEPITRSLYEERLNEERLKKKKVNAFRNNEVGTFCELLIKDDFDENKTKFKLLTDVLPLGGSGYPDLKVVTASDPIFLEIKATSRPGSGSPRDFYYTPGSASDRKIDADGLHVLIGFVTEQENRGFVIKGFKLVDVSKIKVGLKPEFNTDNPGIYNENTLIKLD